MSWPNRIIESLGREPKVGDWFAECCEEDLFQIEDDIALGDLAASYDGEDTGGNVWPTKEEAIEELAQQEQ